MLWMFVLASFFSVQTAHSKLCTSYPTQMEMDTANLESGDSMCLCCPEFLSAATSLLDGHLKHAGEMIWLQISL
jgi:hypothetical protein